MSLKDTITAALKGDETDDATTNTDAALALLLP
jgi:hypothetical protein